ncbi:Oidioi.mRNA.OKI2018_I69.chr1.g1299.t1.cds [Oikopleura dioica]|uniref:Oidioi.mRNA.OKI2018_I69.chr1.g1299.t1.cds n=1 Tax=Oikopleura dioica TaxID=34765 RepID=A0ABN7SMH6_OIKDI|nr:Oidioi.mRNA.OKI2018_I69.chr1.g1299.t1.cds [Oikopleura dioica]
MNIFVSSIDSVEETTMDFGLTYILRMEWQDPRMLFSYIPGEKTFRNRTILNFDLKVLDKLWIPDVQFEWLEDAINVRKIELPQHTLEGLHIGKCQCARGSFSCVEAKFFLSRQMGYYLIQAYIPTMLIVMLSWISFWISITATPARVSLGITTVLTITSQRSALSKALPMVSYVMSIDIWMSICMAYVFAAVVEYAIANFINKPDIDRIARRAFPLSFMLVSLTYYSYYTFCANELPQLMEQVTHIVGEDGIRKIKEFTNS